MKKIYLILLIFAVIIAGCTFKPAETIEFTSSLEEGITAPNTLNVTSNPTNGGELNDLDATTTADVEAIIYLSFDKYLNASTVTENNFEITNDNNAAMFEDYTIEYQMEFKRVKITATFNDDGAYTLTISADNVVTAEGDFLDGNGNGINDGSPYDDIVLQFYTGTGSSDFKDYTHPTITDFGPVTGRVAFNGTFYVTFSEEMDSASVVNNISLIRQSDGASVANDTLISVVGNTYTFYLDSLAFMTLYDVMITCANITDTSGNVLVPYNQYYTTETPEDFSFTFLIEGNAGEDDNPPTVSSGSSISYGADYLTVTFGEKMDISTFTNDNIKMYFYDSNMGGYVYLPGQIIPNDSETGFLYSLSNYEWQSSGTNDFKIYINSNVADSSGLKLDTNGNDIGGESYDPDRIGYESTDNYFKYYSNI